MKKLLFGLACAASLGLWISCSNEAQEVNLKIDTAMVEKYYTNYGTVTATKVTMVTHKGVAVTYDEDGKPNNMPTDGKDWYVSTEYAYNKDAELLGTEYWFYNDWDSGTPITFDAARIYWYDSVEYYDGVAYEEVSNGKYYEFSFSVVNDDIKLSNDFEIISKGGGVYQYDDDYDYGTAKLEVSGSLEGDFTIGTLGKKLDSKYGEISDATYRYGLGDKYTRLDKHITDWGSTEEQDTSVYYLTNVSFTKN